MNSNKKIIEYNPKAGEDIRIALIKMYNMCFSEFVIDFVYSQKDLQNKFTEDCKLGIMDNSQIFTYEPIPNPENLIVCPDFNDITISVNCKSDLNKELKLYCNKIKTHRWIKSINNPLQLCKNINQATEQYKYLLKVKAFPEFQKHS